MPDKSADEVRPEPEVIWECDGDNGPEMRIVRLNGRGRPQRRNGGRWCEGIWSDIDPAQAFSDLAIKISLLSRIKADQRSKIADLEAQLASK